MLWMCIWMCPLHITAAHVYVYQAFGFLPQIWASLIWYVMVKWGDWGCRPNPYSSHIHVIYIKVFDNLYMQRMCIWMCPHHLTAAHVDQVFGILPQIWASLSWYVMVKWGDWGCGPNPYSSHLNYIYKRCLTTFICYGCAYECVHTTLRPLMSTKSLELCHKSGQVSADMWWWNAVIEAVDTTHIHLTSMSAYIRCLTTFICCGCAFGCVPTTFQLVMPTKLLEFC